jgi:hypothetical protein
VTNWAPRGLGRPLRRTGYRLVYRGFADAPLEARAEGRFNRQDQRRTTYLSLTRRTAALEVGFPGWPIAYARAPGIPGGGGHPGMPGLRKGSGVI